MKLILDLLLDWFGRHDSFKLLKGNKQTFYCNFIVDCLITRRPPLLNSNHSQFPYFDSQTRIMNGKGTSETVSLNDELLTWKVLDSKLLDNRSNEQSPISSRYSSCGESEFDRYCSANSVMGTPSLCGSVGTFQDFNESDVGSVKSSRFSDANGLENFSLGGKFDRKFENKSFLGKMNSGDEMETDFSDGGGVVMWKKGVNSTITQTTSTDKSHSINAETMEDKVVNVDVDQNGRNLDEVSEGETSSRLEHSESEGSMFGYGTDNEESHGLPLKGYTNYLNDKKNDGEKTLFMTSSVAYGSDDINDFNQTNIGNPQDLFVIDEFQKQKNVKELPTYSKTHSLEDMFVITKQAEDFNLLEIEEGGPLMDMLPKKPEHTNSNETIENLTLGNIQSTLTQDVEDHIVEMPNDHKPYSLQLLPNINVEKRKNYELNEFYDEIVFEMEEILLDSGESPAARFTRGRKHHNSHVFLPSRDGSFTASTSSIPESHTTVQNPYKIDSIEVIGAKQKKGDVSLGERLVGVKEYTVYMLKIQSGTHQWVVERRYRDFFTLYRRLKTSFSNKGLNLPSSWSTVDRESRKYFGNASPDVVSERSILIQECLQSILHPKFSSCLPNSLLWFLSPPKTESNSPVFNTNISNLQSGSKPVYTLGQSISLIVEIRAHKSMKQILEGQHYTCAGCHKYFDEGQTRLWEFVQTLGFGKPRLCEYSGQVFCSSCHINETAILPARVLHWWDFTEYPVSHLAKSYLDSIHDKPMLCVSAVNPFLFSKVPPLQHVINIRKRIGRMLPFVRCPFRRSIYKGVGSRRYILESSDFFALKDLVDLSKGVFAALPVMVETISKKIVNHITDECLICYDVGVPCGARQACDDPSSLIFPFQEGEVERCKSCELVYHKTCFKNMATCPCGVDLWPRSMRNPNVSPNEMRVKPNSLVKDTKSKYSMGFFSGLLSKASPAKFWVPKDKDTVIPMGSLPNSSL